MPISEDRVRAMREEEELRFTIRHEIEERCRAPQTSLSRTFAFLNTSVGAFLLSTVLVGLFTWVHAELSTAGSREAARGEQRRKLRLEIANRFDEIARMRKRFHAEHRSVIRTAIYGFRPGETRNESWKLYYAGMFPEYRERTLKSLVYELGELCEGAERRELVALQQRVHTLPEYLDKLAFQEEPAGPTTPNKLPVEYYFLAPTDQEAFERDLETLKILQRPP